MKALARESGIRVAIGWIPNQRCPVDPFTDGTCSGEASTVGANELFKILRMTFNKSHVGTTVMPGSEAAPSIGGVDGVKCVHGIRWRGGRF